MVGKLMMAMLVWKILVIRATLLLRSVESYTQVPSKFVISEGIDPTEMEIWYFTLIDSVTKLDIANFCEFVGQNSCHLVTTGALKKLVFVSASYSEAIDLASTFDPIVEAVMPEAYISLVPDSEEDVDE